MSKKKKVILSVITILIAGLSAATIYAVDLFQEAERVVNESHEPLERGDVSEKRDEKIDPEVDNVSILFVGIDDNENRKDESSLADALVLATLNKEESSINLVSIPRDSYVDVTYQQEKDKITHTHAIAGLDNTVSTVENLLDVPVDYYVRMDFKAFVEIVDNLNGITFDVPYNLTEFNSEDEKNAIYLQEGEQVLNGEEALALARTRKYDNDLYRGERQMKILQTIINKTLSFSSVTKYKSLIQSVGDHMTTNITFDEMVKFHNYVSSSNSLDINKHQLDGSDLMKDGVYYFQLNQESVTDIKQKLQNHLEINPSTVTNDKESEEI
ncbi:transcriptional regulator [Halalkalibacillus sediminis]|uniref:Transcriptional regulator n=1 Tax=Halalkalibacillus sediminis TaxID=2018042 RepID=A0A2I0QUE4_9BACI|nr:LCP family protein [Halalkalibacillus sediminis]PKR77972.1 transcriptional regulator [Halalkalibacillus sediminis]